MISVWKPPPPLRITIFRPVCVIHLFNCHIKSKVLGMGTLMSRIYLGLLGNGQNWVLKRYNVWGSVSARRTRGSRVKPSGFVSSHFFLPVIDGTLHAELSCLWWTTLQFPLIPTFSVSTSEAGKSPCLSRVISPFLAICFLNNLFFLHFCMFHPSLFSVILVVTSLTTSDAVNNKLLLFFFVFLAGH